jgi:Nif-specific regulatory protein
VRELENCIESAVVLCEGEILEEHLPLPTVDRVTLLRVLEAVKGNRTAAAKALEIGRNTLARKLKEYGLADEG